MQLKTVRISQFRSIRELRIDFTQPCLALVGINESGKSNILRALRLLDPDQRVEPEDLRDPEHEEGPITEGLVRFIFSLDKSDRDSIFENACTRIGGNAKATLLTRGEQKLTLRAYVEEMRELIADIRIPSGTRYRGTWQLDRNLKIGNNWVTATKAWPASVLITDVSGTERPVAAGALVDTSVIDSVDPSWVEPATVTAVGALIAAAAESCGFH